MTQEAILEIDRAPRRADDGVILAAGLAESEAILAQACLRSPLPCSRCQGSRRYTLRLGRYRCVSCSYTFRRATGRFLSLQRLSPPSWVAGIRGFEAGLTLRALARAAAVAVPTAWSLARTIRLSLAATDPEWVPEVARMLSTPCAEEPRRFRIAASGALLRVQIADEPPPGWRSFQMGALGCVSDPSDLVAARFRRLCAEALRASAGRVSSLQLKEWEFRFNHAGRPLFPLVLSALCNPLPERVRA